MFNNPISRLRTTAIIEAISYLILLFVAMPLKYMFDMPLAVRYVGMAHGVLFILFCLFLLIAFIDRGWSLKRGAIIFISSLIPFAPFFIDKSLKAEEEQLEAANT